MKKIPLFPDFLPLDLDLLTDLNDVLVHAKREISEFTASGLYLFRKIHKYEISRWKELVFILGRGYDGKSYAFPPLGQGEILEASDLLLQYLANKGDSPTLFPVPAALAESAYSNGRWTCEADRDQADYVYSTEDLARLPSKTHHKKRNRLNKFLASIRSDYIYEEFESRHIHGCLELADQWCGIRCSIERPSTFIETEAAKTAILKHEELHLRGGVIKLNEKIKAFCLGEELNPKTFVIHFEKSDPELDGLAALINRDFCMNSLKAYKYVNREQDLGDLGLRQAKESYRPAFLIEKFRVGKKMPCSNSRR